MSPYKVIIAPDSFKESMSAKEAALAIKDGFQEVFDSSTIYDIIPLADGGEGTTEVTNTKQLSLKWQLLQD